MCLVCFINAEESRAKQKELYCQPAGTATPSVSDTETESVDDDAAYHYFAIGSMTNMTALALRELSPISSQPAMLKGYRMVFRGSGGMATAEEIGDYEQLPIDSPDYPFSCIHGVLHLLNAKQMKILDDFEGGYHRNNCVVTLYGAAQVEVNASVYQMDRTKWTPASLSSLDINKPNPPAAKPVIKHELPTERYLDIIAQGCASYGVCQEWVQFVRNHACIPRKHASEFSSFSASMTTATVPIIPWDQVRAHNGLNGTAMWIVINNKVLEFKGDVTSFFPFGYFIKHKIGGTDFTVKFAKGFFEPMYIQSNQSGHTNGAAHSFSLVTSSSQLGNEHRAWVEDQFANPPPVLASSKWALVGVVDVAQQLSDPVTLSRNSHFGMRKSKVIHCKVSSSPGRKGRQGIAEVHSTYSTHSTQSTYNSDGESLDTSVHSTTSEVSIVKPFPRVHPAVSSTNSLQSLHHANNNNSNGSNEHHTESTVMATSSSLGQLNAATVTCSTEILDLTDDILSGYNHFFINGTTAGTWIVPDGLHPGQTLYVRKTATEDFDAPVIIKIRNHSLSRPNKRSESYLMPIDVYYLSWCWDGSYWFLEQVGRAEG